MSYSNVGYVGARDISQDIYIYILISMTLCLDISVYTLCNNVKISFITSENVN